MTPNRRQFLAASAVAASAASLPSVAPAAPKADPRDPSFKLGMVTYNVAAQWDLPTILKICKAVLEERGLWQEP